MQTLIAGGGTIGARLAIYLTLRGEDVTIVEENRERSEWLSKNIDAKVYNGNMLNPELIMEAGIGKADTLIVTLGDDQLTRKVVEFAKSQFGIPRVLAVAKESELCEQIRASGADKVICSEEEVLKEVENALETGSSKTLYKENHNGILISKVAIRARSKALGKQVSKLENKFARVSGIVRNGSFFFPTDDATLEMGDELFVVGREEDVQKVVDEISEES